MMSPNEFAVAGSYVEIEMVLLKPEERLETIPEDTRKVPFVARIKGFLQQEGRIGEEVTILTALKRTVKGTLIAINPPFKHDFGEPIRELLEISQELNELWKA